MSEQLSNTSIGLVALAVLEILLKVKPKLSKKCIFFRYVLVHYTGYVSSWRNCYILPILLCCHTVLYSLQNLIHSKTIPYPVNVWIFGYSIIKQFRVADILIIGGVNLSIPNVNIWWQGYNRIKLLDIVSKWQFLKNLKLKNSPAIIIMGCGTYIVGKIVWSAYWASWVTFCNNVGDCFQMYYTST